MLHGYGEFNKFLDEVVTSMEEAIDDDESQKENNKETLEYIKTIRSEFETIHSELKVFFSARDEEKIMKNLNITLNLLEKLQEAFNKTEFQQFNKTVEEGFISFFFNIEISLLHSRIARIISKNYSK
ncbi:MAG TPA: hypothetical protein VLA74_05725 [Nitrososphaeraceae archaeon]|nr:hypothetical protein [Nitrososphaeraceae archaeon]